jgi:hypothetical protein
MINTEDVPAVFRVFFVDAYEDAIQMKGPGAEGLVIGKRGVEGWPQVKSEKNTGHGLQLTLRINKQ